MNFYLFFFLNFFHFGLKLATFVSLKKNTSYNNIIQKKTESSFFQNISKLVNYFQLLSQIFTFYFLKKLVLNFSITTKHKVKFVW